MHHKYYPTDFDPAKIPRQRKPKNHQIKVRSMLPMSIQCNTCGTYIYKGTKLTFRKEEAIGEMYLGIQIFRLYFNCTKCSAELTIKTDPKDKDYVVESGATRNFEPRREEDEAAESLKRNRDAEEMGDAMKSLENRALDSKQDMDILAALEEMKSINSRHATVSVDDVLATLKRSTYEKEKKISDEIDKADEEVIKSIIFPGSKDFVRCIQDDEDENLDEDWHQSSSTSSQSSNNTLKESSTSGLPRLVGNPTDTLTKVSIFNSSKNGEALSGSTVPKPKFTAKPRAVAKDDTQPDKKLHTDSKAEDQPKNEGESKSNAAGGREMTSGLLSLCQSYDSDESD